MMVPVTRRTALAATGSSLALATVAGVGAFASGASASPLADRVLLLDPPLASRAPRAVRATFGAAQPDAIKRELVRQWRDGLGARILDAGRATALVTWDKVELLRGLAREHRLKVRIARLDRAAFRVDLSA